MKTSSRSCLQTFSNFFRCIAGLFVPLVNKFVAESMGISISLEKCQEYVGRLARKAVPAFSQVRLAEPNSVTFRVNFAQLSLLWCVKSHLRAWSSKPIVFHALILRNWAAKGGEVVNSQKGWRCQQQLTNYRFFPFSLAPHPIHMKSFSFSGFSGRKTAQQHISMTFFLLFSPPNFISLTRRISSHIQLFVCFLHFAGSLMGAQIVDFNETKLI